MATQRTQTIRRNYDLLENYTRAYIDTVSGVAAHVSFFVEVGTFHASDTIKVQIAPGNGIQPVDFSTGAKSLSTAATSLVISAAEMAGVTQLAITRNGTNTSVDPTRGTVIVTQDIEL